jgi:hypothetical protein
LATCKAKCRRIVQQGLGFRNLLGLCYNIAGRQIWFLRNYTMRCRHRAIEFVAPLGLLLALTLVFFWKLLFTNLIYPGYDAFTYFYPYQTYAAEALRNLRLPLWNPRIFTGVPFLANLQAGLLYLPNWPLFLSTSAPKAYAYSVALHVFLAGCSTYLLARFGLGLGHYGALSDRKSVV